MFGRYRNRETNPPHTLRRQQWQAGRYAYRFVFPVCSCGTSPSHQPVPCPAVAPLGLPCEQAPRARCPGTASPGLGLSPLLSRFSFSLYAGAIPSELGLLTQLTRLNLASLSLGSSLPAQLSALSRISSGADFAINANPYLCGSVVALRNVSASYSIAGTGLGLPCPSTAAGDLAALQLLSSYFFPLSPALLASWSTIASPCAG